MLMTIEDVDASFCIETAGCRDAKPTEIVDVGSGIEDDEVSRVEVVRVEYIRSPMTAPASHLIAWYTEEVDGGFVEVKMERRTSGMYRCGGRRHGAVGMLDRRYLTMIVSKYRKAPVSMK